MPIYTSLSAFEEAQEKEFRKKVKELNSYKNGIRYTNDGSWTEEDLYDDIEHEIDSLIKSWHKNNEYRALYNKELLHTEKMLEKVLEGLEGTLIDTYNKYSDLTTFEMNILNTVHRLLDSNLVTG